VTKKEEFLKATEEPFLGQKSIKLLPTWRMKKN